MRWCLLALRECLCDVMLELLLNLTCRISALVICCILVYRCKLPWKWFYITIIALHVGLVVRTLVRAFFPELSYLDSAIMMYKSILDLASSWFLLYYTQEYLDLQDKNSKKSSEYVAALYLTKNQQEFLKRKK